MTDWTEGLVVWRSVMWWGSQDLFNCTSTCSRVDGFLSHMMTFVNSAVSPKLHESGVHHKTPSSHTLQAEVSNREMSTCESKRYVQSDTRSHTECEEKIHLFEYVSVVILNQYGSKCAYRVDIWKNITVQIIFSPLTYQYGANANPRIMLVVL